MVAWFIIFNIWWLCFFWKWKWSIIRSDTVYIVWMKLINAFWWSRLELICNDEWYFNKLSTLLIQMHDLKSSQSVSGCVLNIDKSNTFLGGDKVCYVSSMLILRKYEPLWDFVLKLGKMTWTRAKPRKIFWDWKFVWEIRWDLK